MTDSPGSRTGVRAATVEDAGAVGRLQSEAWREAYAALLPVDVLAAFSAEALAQSWADTLAQPLGPLGVVLLALDAGVRVGVLAATVAGDPDLAFEHDAELTLLAVGPAARGQGHGTRLVTAAVELLRDAGARTLVMWVSEADAGVQAFLETTGWAADGSRRILDLRGDASTVVSQHRLHTALV